MSETSKERPFVSSSPLARTKSASKESRLSSVEDDSSSSKAELSTSKMEIAVSSILSKDDPLMYFVLVHHYSEFVTGLQFLTTIFDHSQQHDDLNSFPKMLSLMRLWLDNRFWDDFWKDGKSTKLLNHMISKFIPKIDKINKNRYNSRYDLEVNKVKLLLLKNSRKLPPSFLNPNALNSLEYDEKREARDFLLSFWILDSRLIAEQFTTIELSLFKKVHEKELMNLNWKKKKPTQASWNVLNMVERFNNVSSWVCTKILKQEDMEQRAGLIKKFIEIAEKAAEMKNFNTLMEIIAALNCNPVDRLKHTWERVPAKSIETKMQLEELMETRNNYKNYRDSLEKCKTTNSFALPYFGIYLRDLVFIDEGNATDKEGALNLDKIQMIANLLKDMKYFQRKDFTNKVADMETQAFFQVLKGLPEEELDRLSVQREALRNQSSISGDISVSTND
eukprot:TRINITY_DN1745_c0_g2_i4.p1 TRINITY_DN1745_c0_g2~~TRINITY_DN1745_c0_g2_i4.p1  ORF type:complete len:449 (-),score=90.03 TRINITY_DN1745_c0_g2_i4:375-1721(-)